MLKSFHLHAKYTKYSATSVFQVPQEYHIRQCELACNVFLIVSVLLCKSGCL